MKPTKIQFYLGTIVLLAILFSSMPEVFAFQNEPDGFRGIKWGTNIKELPDMVLKGDVGNAKGYVKENDKLKIGDADLDSISYLFYQGRLFSVHIECKLPGNAASIKEFLFLQYGEGFRLSDPKSGEVYIWNGSHVIVMYIYHQDNERAMLTYIYKPIADEAKRAKQKE
jgi:hypothetical protein